MPMDDMVAMVGTDPMVATISRYNAWFVESNVESKHVPC